MRRPEPAPGQDPGDTRTVREGLLAIWKANGYRPELQPEPLKDHPDEPPHFPWIWGWLFDFAPGITWSEVESWARVRGIRPQGWECRLLFKLDMMRS